MFKHKEKGQSIIELTFFLIILLILIAGIVEVGAILQTKLAVVNSAREGARFATQSSSDTDVTMVTDAAAANVINYSTDNADIWVIRAKTNISGTIGSDCLDVGAREGAETYWCVTHTLGDGPDVPDFVTKEDIQNSLTGVTDTEIVGVAVAYDHQSIIGLPYAVGGGGMPVTSFTLMKIERTKQMSGCLVWPIAIHKDQVRWDEKESNPLQPGDELDIFDGAKDATMGWLSWDGTGSANDLIDRLKFPSSTTMSSYVNPYDTTDNQMDVGDWVYADSGVVNAKDVREILVEGKNIRILVYGNTSDRTPADGGTCKGQSIQCSYQILGFVTVELKDLDDPPDGVIFEVSGNDKRIEAVFVSYDSGC